MYRRVRNQVRNTFGNTLSRAHAMFMRSPLQPAVINSPFEYYSLYKLLTNHYKCDIQFVSEQVINSSPRNTSPHIYELRLRLKILEDPSQPITYITHIYVRAKILGIVETDQRRKKNMHFRFEREMIMYKEVIPTIKDIQKAWDQFLQFQFYDLFPRFYGASFSLVNQYARKPDHSAAIMIQNLRDTNYCNFTTFCDFNTSEAVVKRLAQVHAIPLAMRIQEHGPYVAKVANVLSRVNQYKDILNADLEYHRISSALSTVYMTEYNIYRYKPDILRHLRLYANNNHKNHVTDSSSWHTICLSKCSLANIWHRTDRIVTPNSIKFSHLQDVEMDSCCSDLIYFLFTSSTNEVLSIRFDDIVKAYFKEFERIMGRHLVLLDDHTFDDFMDEFYSRIYVNIGRILFEIGRLYYALHPADEQHPEGIAPIYISRIIAVIKCMIRKNWLKPM